jgi:hypothetical protein
MDLKQILMLVLAIVVIVLSVVVTNWYSLVQPSMSLGAVVRPTSTNNTSNSFGLPLPDGSKETYLVESILAIDDNTKLVDAQKTIQVSNDGEKIWELHTKSSDKFMPMKAYVLGKSNNIGAAAVDVIFFNNEHTVSFSTSKTDSNIVRIDLMRDDGGSNTRVASVGVKLNIPHATASLKYSTVPDKAGQVGNIMRLYVSK